MTTVKVAGYVDGSMVDGLGVRLVVFFQGCPRHCHDCQNPELIPFDGGRELTVDQLIQEIKEKIKPLTGGITFSGGDPLAQAEVLAEVIKIVKKELPHLNIWVYTGYIYEEVAALPVLAMIDVLVDGPFIEHLKDLSLAFRGSSNQRIIDIPATRAAGQVVELLI